MAVWAWAVFTAYTLATITATVWLMLSPWAWWSLAPWLPWLGVLEIMMRCTLPPEERKYR